MTSSSHQRAYVEGGDAYRLSISLHECPYYDNDSRSEYWIRGYRDKKGSYLKFEPIVDRQFVDRQ